VIPVPAPPGAPTVQAFPVATPGHTGSWPQTLAVSPDGTRLLVPLNPADSAAVIDLNRSDQMRYALMGSGSYPFGAAVMPDGRTGLVTNEAARNVVHRRHMQRGVRLANITVGPPTSPIPRVSSLTAPAPSVYRHVGHGRGRRGQPAHTQRGAHDLGRPQRQPGTMPVALALA